ncbi:hypothetical protein PHYPO_G00155220 [Pangasianodon hypophthalmus]|uniref:M-phase inducer phosphatase n=1 Tax=Pangasianodon hypophthalmus TaxID=310915 RepID=A0A5N5K1R3_PANHP|nr:hypothetical protein PHYPO_G00155220 [Pangasianodon hypophthalmus]
MEMSGHQQDTGWSVSPVSELSSCMQSLQCQDSSTPRRRLDLTPELRSSDRGQASGQHTPTVSRRRSYRKVTSREQASNTRGSQTRSLRGGTEDDEGVEDDKENTSVWERVRVRLFSSSSPEDQMQSVRRSKRQSHSSPAEEEPETPDSESLMLFQRLRSRRNPAHTLIPDSAVTDHCLIGDFSKHHVLPVEKVNHQDLQCVSAQTVASLIRGQFSAVVEDFLIIDCRYPYEYQGGHIKGAVNLYTESQILQAFFQDSSTPQVSPAARRAPGGASVLGTRGSRGATPASAGANEGASSPRKLIVFHCEFSSERGPRLCQYLRELDRVVNAQTYPHLLYPELYLLQGGYKRFYSCCPELCEPHGYVPMRHRDFRDQLRRFSRKRHQHRRRRPIRSQQTTSHF